MKSQALTPRQIDAVRPATLGKNGKPVTQLTDGAGLYLKLQWGDDGKAAGKGHQWRFDYTRPTTGKRNTMSLGAYPTVGLAEARKRAQAAREQVAHAVDPCEVKEAAKVEQKTAALVVAQADERKAANLAPAGTLQGVCQDYHAMQVINQNWSAKHAEQWLAMMTRKVFAVPAVALKPIADVTGSDLQPLLSAIEQAGQVPTARAVRKYLGNVFEYAEARRLSTGNPARVVRKQLKLKHKGGNNPAVTEPKLLAPILRRIRDYQGTIARAALMVQVACFQRPSDTCTMRWADVDLDAGHWVIPAESDDAAGETKIGRSLKGHDHVSPLPRQLVATLRALKEQTGHQEWVFPSSAPERRGLSIANDALSQALRDMGLKGIQTPHGFRATARTILEEVLDQRVKHIEMQLAHAAGVEGLDGNVKRDLLGSAYNRATCLDQRRAMLQTWADYLDGLLAAEPALEDQPLPVEQLMLAA
jgi:integrase